MNEDRCLCLTVHDKAVDFAMRVENETFEGACNFRQAVGVNPVHLFVSCLVC